MKKLLIVVVLLLFIAIAVATCGTETEVETSRSISNKETENSNISNDVVTEESKRFSYMDTNMSHFVKCAIYDEDTFSDVEQDAWYLEYIQTAYEYGLLNGSGSGKFEPSGNITVAETIALASRLNSIYEGEDGVFEQTSPWYKSYVDYAVEAGIIEQEQYSDYTIKANRAQFSIILSNAFPEKALPPINDIEDETIADVPMNSSYCNQAYLLYRSGVLTGSGDSRIFDPYGYIQRDEVAAIVSRMAVPSLRQSFTIDNEALSDTININEALDKAYDNGKFLYLGVGSYEGGYSRALRTDDGTFTWLNGDSFTGTWDKDQMVKGIYHFADGREYCGEFQNGKFKNGTFTLGTMTSTLGYTEFEATYEGGAVTKLDFAESSGLTYSGDVNGNASINYISGNTYEGSVSSGQRSGYGTFIWNVLGAPYSYYEGYWENGVMSGKGKYHYSNSEYPYLDGTFVNGKPDGTAMYFKDDSSVYSSTWHDGVCINLTK